MISRNAEKKKTAGNWAVPEKRAALLAAVLLLGALLGGGTGARAAGLTVVLQDGVRADGPTAAHFDAGQVDPLVSGHMAGRFTLRNPGPAPLVIERLTTSCGCTSALVDRAHGLLPQTLAPGAQVTVAVTVDLSHHRGMVSKTASVYTDAGPSPAVVLEVRGQVHSLLSLTPAALDFGQIAAGTTRTLPLTVTVSPQSRVKTAPALIALNPALAVTPNPSAKTMPGVFAYTVTLSGHAARGPFSGAVVLAPTGGFAADADAAIVRVTGRIVGGVAATPGAVAFGSVIAGTEAVRQVYLSATNPAGLDSLTLSCPSPWVSARLHIPGPQDTVKGPADADTAVDIRVSEHAPPGALTAQVTLVTGTGERLVLPVSAIVVRASVAQARATFP